jgi:uncharacterized surface protein with fasciclin (FAS1) repeats
MKYLPLASAMLVTGFALAACSSSDDTAGSSSGGSGGSGAVSASGGKGGASSGGTSAGGAAAGGKGGAATGGTGGSAPIGDGEAGSAGASGSGKDIVQTALAAGNFTKLAGALTAAGLVDTLEGPGPFTVFAPDDAAFAAFEAKNPGVLAGLSKADLTTILTYHVVAGAAVTASELKNDQVFTTVSGSPVLIDKGTGVQLTDGIKADDASVTTPDIEASNGVIHVIDFIIQPPSKDIVATAVTAGNFTKLAGALTTAGLVPTLQGKGPFTVFAPTDAAFAGVTAPTGDTLVNLLKYHVVGAAAGSGDLTDGQTLTTLDAATTSKLTVDLTSGVKIKDSTTTAANVGPANILAKNGVIHVVDKVLLPK